MKPKATVSFLFTDIEASTLQWETEPEMHERVEHHYDILRSAIAANGGELVTSMGDGVVSAFASAEGAVRAAIIAQRQMPASGLKVRMGVHTGEARRAADDYRGRPLNRAARIMAVGHGGQILLSGITAALVQSGPTPVDLADLGVHKLRDFAEPEHLWQVVHPDLERRFPPLRGVAPAVNNLPLQRSSLVGRDFDVARVVALLDHHRVVTLTGVGGIGKTRLALHTAADVMHRFSAAWLVELAPVVDADDVVAAIAIAVGADSAARSLDAVVTALGSQPVLLVLDNCEHVLDAAAAAADALAAACPKLTILSTSRAPLAIDGEHLVPVRSLDPGHAGAQLFEQRAAAGGAVLTPSQRPIVRHICERLDGHPLAIELAAARVKPRGLAAVVAGLDDPFELLAGGRRGTEDRHRTMRANIDWSFQLLAADEQHLFQWLAVLRGGFDIDAVRRVAENCSVPLASVTDLVASLVRTSVLEVAESSSGVRYRMLEPVRAFALEKLESHRKWVAALAGHDVVASISDLAFADQGSASGTADASAQLRGDSRTESPSRAVCHRHELVVRMNGVRPKSNLHQTERTT